MYPSKFRRLKRRYRKQRGKCAYCRTTLSHKTATRDHVIPRAAGGRGGPKNIALACYTCNRAKADLPADEFRARIVACDA